MTIETINIINCLNSNNRTFQSMRPEYIRDLLNIISIRFRGLDKCLLINSFFDLFRLCCKRFFWLQIPFRRWIVVLLIFSIVKCCCLGFYDNTINATSRELLASLIQFKLINDKLLNFISTLHCSCHLPECIASLLICAICILPLRCCSLHHLVIISCILSR